MSGFQRGSNVAKNLEPRRSTQSLKSAASILFGRRKTGSAGSRMVTGAFDSADDVHSSVIRAIEISPAGNREMGPRGCSSRSLRCRTRNALVPGRRPGQSMPTLASTRIYSKYSVQPGEVRPQNIFAHFCEWEKGSLSLSHCSTVALGDDQGSVDDDPGRAVPKGSGYIAGFQWSNIRAKTTVLASQNRSLSIRRDGPTFVRMPFYSARRAFAAHTRARGGAFGRAFGRAALIP